jgi:acetyl-CoA acetyltransferase
MLGQLVAWGEVRVGLQFTAQAFTFAVIYAGIAAFFSALLDKGDLPATVAVFFVAAFWIEAVQGWEDQPLTPGLRRLVTFMLPPHTAATEVYNGLISGSVAWGAAAHALGYGLFWLVLAGLLVKYREWP